MGGRRCRGRDARWLRVNTRRPRTVSVRWVGSFKAVATNAKACLSSKVNGSDSFIEVQVLQGANILPFLDQLAHLRIRVFREWPYLYDGDYANEREYLRAFSESPSSVMVIARDTTLVTSPVVGVSTAMALADESGSIRDPFVGADIDVSQWFYLAESVLLEDYRGRGLGHRFFDEREAAGRRAGFRRFTFCAVQRSDSDPRKPPGTRRLEPFWRGRGYAPLDLRCSLEWKEVGAPAATSQTLRFWGKTSDAP